MTRRANGDREVRYDERNTGVREALVRPVAWPVIDMREADPEKR